MPELPRPDPDRLLAQIGEAQARARRGRLKIFFGASAGVGKTCAMLAAAHAERAQGVDLLVGIVETHGRVDTQALLDGLEVLAPKPVASGSRRLAEFDLDAALARRPGLVLVDELAHSNLPGCRHPKRWQDVAELLEAGIDVWSTMNVQHLESLNDIVGGITGIRVRETVPDRVFDTADEVVIVDLPPDDLLQRLKDGKVYLPSQAERAGRNFFRKGNLIALRELALRRTADRVDGEVLRHRQGSRAGAQPVWGNRESVLACVGPGDDPEKTVRPAARLAAQLGAPWHAVYVETPALQRLADAPRRALLRTLELARDMGAHTATLADQDVAAALVRYARHHNLSKVVLGRSRRSTPWRRGLAARIEVLGEDLDLVQVARPAVARRPGAAVEPAAAKRPFSPRPYALSAASCAATALLAAPLAGRLEPSNIVMLFLLAVVGVAVRLGRGPAVLAAFLSVLAFDFFFVAPTFSFAIGDVQYLVTFAVMLAVALVIGQMAAGLTYQARVAQRREDRMRALYEMSRDLSGALMPIQVAEIGARFLGAQFDARAVLLTADLNDRLQAPVPEGNPPEIDPAIAQWSHDKGEAAGLGTGTLPASPTLYMPLQAPMRLRGVLALQPRDPARLAVPEQRRLLDTCASLLAMSLERIHYVEVARDTTLQMESERLRNSLLAAISHDLRTPLTSLVGMADALTTLAHPPLQGEPLDLARTIRDSALRMNALVTSLLDMARLESGAVHLNRQWQPLEEVVGSSIAALRPALGSRPVSVSIPEDVPLVHIDAVLIERVLVNLLENAVKYTPAGTPIALGAAADGGTVSLWVEDRGPGLPPGREEAIFSKFERGQKESATPGVGLGLAICRAIAGAHGGRLAGETLAGGGARFTLSLPRGVSPDLQPPAGVSPGWDAEVPA